MFLNFSVMPLRIGTLVGFLMAGLGIFVFMIVLLEALRGGTPQGYASLMGAVLLLAGVQLIMLGLVGEYLGRLFLTINPKPQFEVLTLQRTPRAALPPRQQGEA